MMLFLERSLSGIGFVGLVLVALVYLDSAVGAREAVAAFNDAADETAKFAAAVDVNAAANVPDDLAVHGVGLAAPAPDQTLWSEKAKLQYANASTLENLPLALLAIERLDLQVPVFPGTDRFTLNRGAGLVDGTAYPGESGNIVLSAHRDSFFRPLKDIRVGDTIALRTLEASQRFKVAEIFITDPLDISVLDPTDTPTLTLITCYPFYYVGFAPERLIVRAVPVDGDERIDSVASAAMASADVLAAEGD